MNKQDTSKNVIKLWHKNGNSEIVLILPPYGGNHNYYNTSKLPSLLKNQGIDFGVVYAGDIGYLEEYHLQSLDSLITHLVKIYNYNKDKIVLGGFSAGGYGALKYGVFSKMKSSKLNFIPTALFSVDAPLDLARWYESLVSITERNNKESMVYHEAFYVSEMLNKLYGGSPAEKPNVYEKNGVFTNKSREGGNAKYLINTPIMLFTEPDINWYIENMNLDFTQINAIDQAALINFLRRNGNKNAHLIITSGKGYRPELGNMRMPHSWQIVDEKMLAKWVIKQLNK